MYNSQSRLNTSRSNSADLQNAVRRRLMKDKAPLLKTTYGGNKKFVPQKEKG